MSKHKEISKPYKCTNIWNRPIAVEVTSEDLIWIDFKGHEIRVDHYRDYNDGKLMITVYKPNDDFHTKVLIDKIENEKEA